MKNKVKILSALILSLALFAGCKEKTEQRKEPSIDQVRNICNLATVESYYHNVAKSVKPKGVGLSHIGENDRKFWIEYTGLARLGIDIGDVTMEVSGADVKITLPKAQVLSISIDMDSLGEESYISSQDGFNSNKISAEDQTKAIKESQEQMKEKVMNDEKLLLMAQNRAKKLIENYLIQLGKTQGIDYKITWDLQGLDTNEKDQIKEGSMTEL